MGGESLSAGIAFDQLLMRHLRFRGTSMRPWNWLQWASDSSKQKNKSQKLVAARFGVEALESRTVLSASSVLDTLVAEPSISPAAVTQTTPVGLTPAEVAKAYGFDQIYFSGIKGTGAGQTIAIVDAYDNPNIASDLHIFDQTFGIADPPSFTVYKQTINGVAPKTDSGWAMEIALDVEWAHAIAPDANIVLVEANTSSVTNLLSAVDYARSIASVSVISMSWGSSEFMSESSYDYHFTTPAGHQGITFVASSGDAGAPAEWPAVSPNVLAVGGTTLSVSSNGTYQSETAWSDSGGGYSKYEAEPSYQSGVQNSKTRSNPDVAYNANPSSGFAVYDTVASSGKTGWFEVGGTSAGAPQWAALVAIADQGRALAGKATLANAQVPIYSLSTSDFHDVTSGSNGYSAAKGYDLVTGRGSPVANAVVRDLVSYSGSTTYSLTSSTSSTHRVIYIYYYGFGFRAVDGTDGTDAATGTSSLTVIAITLSDGHPTSNSADVVNLSADDITNGDLQIDELSVTDWLQGEDIQSAKWVDPENMELPASDNVLSPGISRTGVLVVGGNDDLSRTRNADGIVLGALDEYFSNVSETNGTDFGFVTSEEETRSPIDIRTTEWSAEYLAIMAFFHVSRGSNAIKNRQKVVPTELKLTNKSHE